MTASTPPPSPWPTSASRWAPGTDVAIEASDLTLVRGDLRVAGDAIRLSRRTLRTIKTNLFWAFGYNVAAIPLAAAGLLNPLIAGASIGLSSVSSSRTATGSRFHETSAHTDAQSNDRPKGPPMPHLPKQPRPSNKQTIRQAWANERTAARQVRTAGDSAAEWDRLERAHILSQPLAVAHIRTHVAMLGYGIRHRNRKEIVGQLARMLVAGPSSAIRRYPLGNTGGANVSAVMPMAIPADLRALLDGTVASS